MSQLNEIYDPEDQADPDYEPSENDESETTTEIESETTEESNIIIYFDPFCLQPPPPPPRKMVAKRSRFEEGLSNEEALYFQGLPEDKKQKVIESDSKLRISGDNSVQIPLKFKILESQMDQSAKRLLLAKLDHFQRMSEGSSEYFKLRNWLSAASRLPLGRYNHLPVTHEDPVPKIKEFLHRMRATLDNTVYGHTDTKDHIMRIFAQWIANPMSKGNVIGIQGPMGCGKTSLVKDGICKALQMPFGFIALGGASDGSFLDGHSFTYEGSMYGKIAEVLMKTGVMNPIFFFDELDKISQSHRGEEVAGILMHLTDSSQNERFNDKYFAEIDLDLSKALIIFSYNDETLLNPILKDRMITVKVSGYTKKEKIKIATKHLIPDILAQFGMSPDQVIFPTESIERIIERVDGEEGVRNLKRGIETIVSWLNISRYLNSEEAITFPFEINVSHVDNQLKQCGSNGGRSCPIPFMYM